MLENFIWQGGPFYIFIILISDKQPGEDLLSPVSHSVPWVLIYKLHFKEEKVKSYMFISDSSTLSL